MNSLQPHRRIKPKLRKFVRGIPGMADAELSLAAIAERLIMTREALGLTQAAFCRISAIATNTYNQYEKAKQIPRLDMAIRMCRAHRLTLDWIYMGDPSGLPSSLHEKIKEKRRSTGNSV